MSKKEKVGVLIVNLGTPDEPTTPAVRRYLREFLSDPRVIDLPRWKWLPILYSIVLVVRPKRSAAAYQSVWTDEGSPLLLATERLAAGVVKELKERGLNHVEVEVAMRYGNPSTRSKIEALKAKGISKIVVVPLYPQYSDATTASTYDGVMQSTVDMRFVPEFRFVGDWHDDPTYIDLLAKSIEQDIEKHGKPERVLFSFHGIPKRYADEGDPYYEQCCTTAKMLAERLNYTEDDYIFCFQSRFGSEEWLQPYADETIKGLPKKGVTDIAVICPGFSTDCLETIEEMGEENKEVFLENGGKNYRLIDCLNDSPGHVSFITDLVEKNLW